jgi:hypothetical protein
MLFPLLQWQLAVHSKCLLGGQGSAGTRPEHRCKSGMDGGLTAAILLCPPLYLRATDFLSKRWGPPQAALCAVRGGTVEEANAVRSEFDGELRNDMLHDLLAIRRFDGAIVLARVERTLPEWPAN